MKDQRKNIKAPVDKYGLVSIPKNYSVEEFRFLTLLSLLLSSQTKDEYTSESVQNFIDSKITSIIELSKLKQEEIKNKIMKVGFANKKSEFLYKFGIEYYGKRLPDTLDEVMKIKGIGRKMAYLYLQYGCNKIEGIGVDTHVLRLSQRIGITKSKNAEVCRRNLETIFDRNDWKDINYTMVGFGQIICIAKNPKCGLCNLKNICISSKYRNW